MGEHKFMEMAIQLAMKAKGRTSPNPLVGAVVVKDGRIAGCGYHKKAGTAHAEVIAIKKAGRAARGAELYVNLEPCVHFGRTPPCVNNIVKNGIAKVYIAMKDPNPLVNGKGIKILRKNRVAVELGLCREKARKINIDYIIRVKKQGS